MIDPVPVGRTGLPRLCDHTLSQSLRITRAWAVCLTHVRSNLNKPAYHHFGHGWEPLRQAWCWEPLRRASGWCWEPLRQAWTLRRPGACTSVLTVSLNTQPYFRSSCAPLGRSTWEGSLCLFSHQQDTFTPCFERPRHHVWNKGMCNTHWHRQVI